MSISIAITTRGEFGCLRRRKALQWCDHLPRKTRDCFEGIKSGYVRPDFKIVCGEGGVVFPCHKFILRARSSVFRAMLSHQGFREVQESRLDIRDFGSKAVAAMVHYLYAESLVVNRAVAWQVLGLADKYDISGDGLQEDCARRLAQGLDCRNISGGLKEECAKRLAQSLDCSNVMETMVLAAELPGLDVDLLLGPCFVFLRDNIRLMQGHRDWRRFVREGPRGLKEECAKRLAQSLDCNNVIETMVLAAELPGLDDNVLLRPCIVLVRDNLRLMQGHRDWRAFVRQHPGLGRRILEEGV